MWANTLAWSEARSAGSLWLMPKNSMKPSIMQVFRISADKICVSVTVWSSNRFSRIFTEKMLWAKFSIYL